jgi:Histidine kinase-, DNA gyrase B-, and HSP90-like ATPase
VKDTSGELTVTSKKTPEGQLLISVSDSGIGIAPDRADRIFEAFITTKPQGTGMGLSISRRIIESHGGACGRASTPGGAQPFSSHCPTDDGILIFSCLTRLATTSISKPIGPRLPPIQFGLYQLLALFLCVTSLVKTSMTQ